MEKIRLRQAIIVEGKYDKIKLESFLDALILPIDGFQIYRDRERQAFLRSLAESCGIVVVTDSDAAGFRIRSYIAGLAPQGEVIHVYIPDIFGKEKRKALPSAEGKLGVEGMTVDTLRECFSRAGVLNDGPRENCDPITRHDLYADGITGGRDSAARRRILFRRLGLPARLSSTAALRVLNQMLTREEYRAIVRELDSPR